MLEVRRLLSVNVGEFVRTTAALNVRTGPGTSYELSPDPNYPGSAPTGTLGYVIAGPTSANGYTWYEVDYGPSKYTGWSIQDYLTPVAENYVRGVDVASFQGTSINWSQTLNTGIEFAFVKGTEGTSYVNPDLNSQAGGAHAAGLATGVYDFGHPDVNASTAGAVAEADYFINNAGQYTGPGYLPPVLDLEVGSSLGKTILTNWVVAWANEVQARTGVKPIIYVNTNYASNYLNSNVSAYTLWVANYTYSLDSQPGTGVWPGYTFWQYAGGPSGGTYDQTSIIPGINSINSDGSRNGPAVDGDVFAGTLAQLQAMVVHSYTNTADWHLDGNGNDASGDANPLTTVNGPAFTSGAFGQSLDTNSVNQYATSALPVVNTSLPYTVSAWVNWSGLGGYQAAASQDGNNASAFFLGKRDDNHFAFIVNSSDTNAPGQTAVAWGTAPSSGTWYHLVGEYTGSQIKLYVNGQFVGSSNFSSGFAATGSTVVGAAKVSGSRGQYWGGLIDEVQLFNSALSDNAVADLYDKAPLSAGWTDADIGGPAVAGWASADGTKWTVAGGGSDIWGSADQFNYNFRSLSGNGTLVAYVASQQITDAWAKSGVMFRNDTSAASAFAAIVATPGNGISFVWRTSVGAQAQQVNTGSPAAPVWLKLVRSDNNFSGYYSTDDVSWIQVGSTQNASIAAQGVAGLAVCSHNNGTSSTAAFNNVSVLPAGWSDVDIGSPGLSGEATSDGTTWTITGGGADIYGTSDQFNFVSESVTGDAAAIVNVASLGIPEAWSKAGLMVRNDASASSAFADVVLTPGNGVAFQWRSSSGAGAQSVNIAGPGAPEWLKMVRSGDNFSAYYSADDVNWMQVGSNQSISIGSTAMIGLAVTSHDNSVFNTASFASLSIDTPPVVSGTSGTSLSWTEALPPAAPPVITIAPGLSISDASSPQLTAATVAITSGLSSPEDVLGWDHSLAASDGIGVAYSAADGTLSLSGTASLSQYQIVLQSVTYSDTSQNPSTLQRTINFSVTDANGLLSGVTASSQQVIDVTAVDNPPTVGASAGSDAYTAGNSALLVDAALTVTDPDSASLAGATVSIVGNHASGDALIFADQNGITGSYSNGVLMLTGNASVASYQSALQSITFASTNNSTATRTVSYVVNDGSLNSASATKLIDVFAPVDVTGVYVKGSTWNTTFLDDLATNGLGSSTLGFRMQTGANQLEPLPWNNLDTIEIVFSGAVNVSQNSLSLIGSPNQAHAPPSIAGFSYDATTHTATWSLSGSLNDNRLLLDLPAAGVTDSRGATLDGEFANTTTTPTVIGQAFPSGNGLSGGDFTFQFNVLPGDVNQDGVVNGLDISLVATDWLRTGAIASDTNGDNVVNGLDISAIASNWLTTLPAGGVGGGSEAATIMGGDAAVGSTASIATASSVLESPTVLASIATSASGTGTSSSGLVISTAPAFSSMQAADRLAAFIGRPDVTKVVATIDHVFSQGAGAQSQALGPSVRSGIVSLVKPHAATGSHGTRGTVTQTEPVGEQWSSPIDDDLLATMAASRRL